MGVGDKKKSYSENTGILPFAERNINMKYACHQEVVTWVEKHFKVQSDILFQLIDNENFIRKSLGKKSRY